jgi:CRISPR-associated protein (TIGR03986 family)
MSKYVRPVGPVEARRDGSALVGTLAYDSGGKRPAPRTWPPRLFDEALAGWFTAASDGDHVEVYVDLDSDAQPQAVRMAHPPVFTLPVSDPHRLEEADRRGGEPNPYTFIPTLPRGDLPPGLEDGPPAPHGVIDPASQWSGWLVLRLATRTPLLLPDAEAVTRDGDKHPTYPVRTGPDGQPLLHGASVKGALRSAYEVVTDSRYGVFRGHDRPLAYRRPASSEDRTPAEPARVEPDGHGGLAFRLCDTRKVPLYDPRRPRAQAVGQARQVITRRGGPADWRELHGRRVVCTTRGRGLIAKVALPADERLLWTEAGPRVRGWLSVTGQSIGSKKSERLFVPKQGKPIKIGDEHHKMWHAVLASYHDVAEQRDSDEPEPGLQRPEHTLTGFKVPDHLAEGDLVYLERDQGKVTAISPVYIGRLPYQSAPAELLDRSLHPAASLDELSPADRLFGWVPPQAGPGRAAASGYRGRIRITSVRCETADWRTEFPEPGVTLAPLSTPQPTQFRFYAASDAAGSPMPPRVSKEEGYKQGSGLRGRKAYWYPGAVDGDYWTPGTGQAGGRFREWQEPPGAARSQTSTHQGWVRAGAEFTVRLFLDAVPGPELGPLIWLASQDGCPLRLGAAKPLGFGAVSVTIDWEATELRTGGALAGCWTALRRPDPSPAEQIRALADDFAGQARQNPVLAPAIAAFTAIAVGSATPAAYPRTRREPEAETYRWFVANEKIANRRPEHGIALPHALEQNQDLPYLSPGE